MDPVYEPFVTVATLGDLTAAQVVAARLRTEGLEAIVQGEAMGPYPVTVGKMAHTAVLVPESMRDRAMEILDEVEAESGSIEQDPGGEIVHLGIARSIVRWIVAAVLLGIIVWSRVALF